MVTPDDDSLWVDVIGHYDDELVRGPDGWRIRRRVRARRGCLAAAAVRRDDGSQV